jgi:hypothetical protein
MEVPTPNPQSDPITDQETGSTDCTFSGVVDLQGCTDDNGAPARLSAAEWMQNKSQLPQLAASSLDAVFIPMEHFPFPANLMVTMMPPLPSSVPRMGPVVFGEYIFT